MPSSMKSGSAEGRRPVSMAPCGSQASMASSQARNGRASWPAELKHRLVECRLGTQDAKSLGLLSWAPVCRPWPPAMLGRGASTKGFTCSPAESRKGCQDEAVAAASCSDDDEDGGMGTPERRPPSGTAAVTAGAYPIGSAAAWRVKRLPLLPGPQSRNARRNAMMERGSVKQGLVPRPPAVDASSACLHGRSGDSAS